MKKVNNIDTFLQNQTSPGELNKDINKLITFLSISNIEREITSILPFIKIKKSSIPKIYVFNYKEKEYPFSLFQEEKLQQIDKKILKPNQKNKKAITKKFKTCLFYGFN